MQDKACIKQRGLYVIFNKKDRGRRINEKIVYEQEEK